jgi:hypothetical protein
MPYALTDNAQCGVERSSASTLETHTNSIFV